MTKPLLEEYVWLGKKPPEYCRPHGRRIVGFNNVGLCSICRESFLMTADALTKAMESVIRDMLGTGKRGFNTFDRENL